MNNHLEELKIGGRPMTKNEIKIKELQQENQQLKEIIEKTKKHIKENKIWGYASIKLPTIKRELLDILNGDDK